MNQSLSSLRAAMEEYATSFQAALVINLAAVVRCGRHRGHGLLRQSLHGPA